MLFSKLLLERSSLLLLLSRKYEYFRWQCEQVTFQSFSELSGTATATSLSNEKQKWVDKIRKINEDNEKKFYPEIFHTNLVQSEMNYNSPSETMVKN